MRQSLIGIGLLCLQAAPAWEARRGDLGAVFQAPGPVDGALGPGPAQGPEDTPLPLLPAEPTEIVEWLALRWTRSGWSHPDLQAAYLRDPADNGWKARFRAMQALLRKGEGSVAALLDALQRPEQEVREFAAQTLSFVASHVPQERFLNLLETDANPTVRLYAADALGAAGHGALLADRLEAARARESNRDVKKHIGYTLSRGAEPADSRVLADLLEFDVARMSSARIGEPAPDLDLESFSGGRVRLSSFRGVAPVVLVFLYGDT